MQYHIYTRDREGRLVLTYVEPTPRDAERTIEYLVATGHKVEMTRRVVLRRSEARH